MSVRCGIVGTPNAGKSTLFNALTNANVPAENFPFCTIDPNTGSVAVPDHRLAKIASVVGVDRIVPVTIDFVDIAGLVEGASRGEGLGNRFLSHIREMDIIAQVVGCFDEHSDWQSEIEVVNLELMLADLTVVEKALDKVDRLAKTGEKKAMAMVKVLTRVKSGLENGQPVSAVGLDRNEVELLGPLQLLTAKRKFCVLNVAEQNLDHNPQGATSEAQTFTTVAICAQLEAELATMPAHEQASFRIELGYSRSAIDSVVQAAYSELDLMTFFTFNDSEVRGWAMPNGRTAKQAAGLIHTDMETGFIKAAVMAWEDFVSMGSEQAVKQAGKLRIEGKDYRPLEGEILHIRFNT